MKHTIESAILRLKRADTPVAKAANKFVKHCFGMTMPVPRSLKPFGRILYEFRFYVPVCFRRLKSLVYTTPMFSCRCESVGKRLQMIALPNVHGHTVVYVGDDVQFSGSLSISSGRFNDRPTLRIGDRSFLGHNVSITCNQEVVIEEDVLIAGNCRISDYDGHPSSLERRLSHDVPDAKDIRPVRICKGAWIGSGAFIFKGVTIGTGAVGGANSAVTHDVPPYCVVAGSPARIVKRVEEERPGRLAAAVAGRRREKPGFYCRSGSLRGFNYANGE